MATIETIFPAENAENEKIGEGSRKGRIGLWTGRVLGAIARWWRIRLTRQGLAELDDDLLRDIGVTPQEARNEMRKSLFLMRDMSSFSGGHRDLSKFERW